MKYIIFSLMVSLSLAAAASYVSHPEVIRHSSGLCLDIRQEHSDPGTDLILFDCHGRWNQLFTLNSSAPLQKFAIYNETSATCVDLWEESVSTGSSIKTFPCHGRDNQVFIKVRDANGMYLFVNPSSQKCLGVINAENRVPVQLLDCSHSGARWMK